MTPAARAAIADITLDLALAPHDVQSLRAILTMADALAATAQQYANRIRTGATALTGQPAVASLLSIAAQERNP